MAGATTPRQVLEDYSQKFIDALKKSLVDNNRFASGVLSQSIKAPVKIMGQKVVLEIRMDEYWKFVEYGRKAGAKQPPQDAMLDFIRDRGISVELSKRRTKKIKSLKNKKVKKGLKQQSLEQKRKSLAFILGRSIAKKGIKPTHFASEVMNGKLRETMEKELSASVGRLIKVEIASVIDNGNNNK